MHETSHSTDYQNNQHLLEDGILAVLKWMSSQLITIEQDNPVSLAFELLLTNDIRHLPVVSEDKLVGIVTDRDLNEALIPADSSRASGGMYHTVKDIKVSDIMTPNPITVQTDTPIEQATQILLDRKIDCLPVKDTSGELTGIITSTDILAAFVEITTILGGTRRMDVIMEAGDYENILEILQKHSISVISIGISAHQELQKTVFSFRIQDTNVKMIASLLRREGYTVLAED